MVIVERLCATLSMTQPRVRVCRRVAEAVAIGLFKPMILLPAAWLTELPPDMLEAVLAHELAHVRRLDLWVNLLQRLVETLLFYHPAVWWLSRRLRVERELCCDELAATVTNDRVRYAETLEHVARLTRASARRGATDPAFSVAMSGREGVLLHRIQQLLGVSSSPRNRSTWFAGAMTLGLVLILALGTFVSSRAEVEPSSIEQTTNQAKEAKPPTLQLSEFIERLKLEEQKYARIEVVVRSQQQPLKVLDHETQQTVIVRRLIRDRDLSYYHEVMSSQVQETETTSRIVYEETVQGRWWRQRVEATRRKGANYSNDSLFVLPKANHRLSSHTLGLGYWLERPESLSDLLTDETPGRRKIVELLGEETIDAERCVKLKERSVSAGTSKFYRLVWLAFDKNLLPLRSELRDENAEGQRPASVTQVTEWQELQPGIWFPKSIESHQPRKSATASDKMELERTHSLTVELATLQPQIERGLFDKLGKPPSNEPVSYKCRVITSGTKAPIVGATVVFKRMLMGDPRYPNEPEHLIEKTTHVTDADGWYEVTIPPEQLAERYLYLELDVTHSEHPSRIGHGYAMSMIRKNELAGDRPFFETTILHPGRAATGTVVTPDGRPAADVKVVGFCYSQPRALDRGARIATRTDAEGKYRVVVPASGGGAFWLVPDNACPFGVVVSKEGGDLGTLTLKRGLRPSGQVLDADGRAIAGMHVAMSRQDSESPDIDRAKNDPYWSSAYSREAVTDSEGRFVMPPVEPGKYEFEISPNAVPSAKFSGTFLIQSMSIDANAKPLELRAVPSVEIRAQNVNSQGQPIRSFEFNITGEINGQYFVGESSRPNNGHTVARVPRGLKDVEVRFADNEHGIVRIRRKPGAPLESIDRLKIPSIDEDIEGIEVVRYKAPILLVKAVDAANQPIPDFTPNITYTTVRDPKVEESEEARKVRLEHQSDGRWRTKSFFPDEDVTVSVAKKGWKAEPQKVRLAEGEERELIFVLKPQAAVSAIEGEVLSIDRQRQVAVISLGEGDTVKKLMKFEVRAKAPANGKAGEPVVKGTVEVIRVNEKTSEVRILKEDIANKMAKGDAVIDGDSK